MMIGSLSGSYGIYPFMTRVSVGDRPVTAVAAAPEGRAFSEGEPIQPFDIPTYKRDKSMSAESSTASTPEAQGSQANTKRLSVYA
jgi:hypothetical protein